MGFLSRSRFQFFIIRLRVNNLVYVPRGLSWQWLVIRREARTNIELAHDMQHPRIAVDEKTLWKRLRKEKEENEGKEEDGNVRVEFEMWRVGSSVSQEALKRVVFFCNATRPQSLHETKRRRDEYKTNKTEKRYRVRICNRTDHFSSTSQYSSSTSWLRPSTEPTSSIFKAGNPLILDEKPIRCHFLSFRPPFQHQWIIPLSLKLKHDYFPTAFFLKLSRFFH